MSRGVAACCWASGAVACAAAFTLWALLAPVYSDGSTIVEVNGRGVLPVLLAPLAITVATWLLLRGACVRDSVKLRTAARAIAWALVAFAVISGFSIGMFVAPAAIALAVAAGLTPVAARGSV